MIDIIFLETTELITAGNKVILTLLNTFTTKEKFYFGKN